MNKGNLVFYDTETTGIPNWKVPSDAEEQPHLVELAAILCNKKGKILDEFSVIIKPNGWVITQEMTDIHGISHEEALEKGIAEEDALQMLFELCNGAERVAFNKTFDQRIIRIAAKRYATEDQINKWAIKEDHHCAMRLARSVMGGKNPKLCDAYKHFTGEDLVDAHNAMADTKACMKVYFKALEG